MHAHSIDDWRHDHVFLGADHARNERRRWAVVAVCGAMMAAEIIGGLLSGSMALIADGLHMSTHAGALVIAACAYAYARRHARGCCAAAITSTTITTTTHGITRKTIITMARTSTCAPPISTC
jgi:Co/Zn/Cd efflux system component